MKYLGIIAIVLTFFTVKSQTQVDIFTNYGDIRLELYDSLVPITAGNFINLINQEFYDDVIFHRVIDNFMIQGGAGTPVPPPIQDEFDTQLSNVQQTISMANSGPNTGTCQFFINLVDNTYLDFDKPPYTSAHPVFGITITGFNVVQTIGAVATDGNNKPLTDVVMDSVRIVIPVSVPDIVEAGIVERVAAWPNPLSESTNINFEVKVAGLVDISIYDLQGRLVKTLIDGKRAVGIYNTSWNGTSMNQGDVPDGLYLLHAVTPSGTKTLKLIKLR